MMSMWKVDAERLAVKHFERGSGYISPISIGIQKTWNGLTKLSGRDLKRESEGQS